MRVQFIETAIVHSPFFEIGIVMLLNQTKVDSSVSKVSVLRRVFFVRNTIRIEEANTESNMKNVVKMG